MHYGKHYKLIASLHGLPRLNYEQTQRFLNIVSVESRINELEQLDALISDKKGLWKRKEALKETLFKLTKLEAPYRLLDEMIERSQADL